MSDNNTDRDEQQKDEVWCGNPACHFCRHRNLVPAAFAAASSSLPAEPPPNEHYFIVTQMRDKCGYSGCKLGPLDHPEIPKHNFQPLQPTGEQEKR